MSLIKSIGAVSAALGLVLASVIMASPASADDAVPPADPATVTATEPSVAPDSAASGEATSEAASTAGDVKSDVTTQPEQPELSKSEVSQKADVSASTAAWTLESTANLEPTECWKEGDQPVLIGGAINIAPGEQFVTIKIDGNDWAGDAEYRAAVGVHTYTLTVKNIATGETGTSQPKTFTVEACVIPPTNHAPIATDSSVTTTSGVAVNTTLSATDQDGDTLTYEVASGPSHGSLSGSGSNLVYTSTAGYSGSDTFTWKATDSKGATSDVATVTITVKAVTPPPFTAYEVGVYWKMDNPNFDTPKSYDFPQTRLAGMPEATCTPIKIQFDKYWIRDKADEEYLAGLTKLNSRADDARLDPHGYYAKIIVLPTSECQPKPANPTAVVTCDHCSDANAANGTATVTVTNVADETKAKATYTVTLNGVSKEVTLADGKSGKVHFSGLAPGTYDVMVVGNDSTSVKTSVKIDECKVTPPPAKKDATASIVVTPATCTAAGSVAWGNLVNAVATDLNQSVGTHVATSPAIEGHLFSDGMSVWEQEYTIQAQLAGKDCPPVTLEPKVEIVYGQWQGGQPDCKTPTVTWSRTVTTVTTTYGWEWDAEAGKYNPTTASSEASGAPQTKLVEYGGKDCSTSPLTGTGAPQTGGSGDTTSPMNGWIGGGLLTAAVAALVVGVLRRRRA